MSIFDQVARNETLKEFKARLGFGKQAAQREAEKELEATKQAYEQLNPPELVQEHPEFASVSEQTPSEMGTISVNPAYRASQMDELAALSNLAKNGGRNAASDAALADIRARELQNARGQREAVMQNANARGMGGSGAEIIAMLNANQNAQNNENMQDLGVLGQQANTAINAGMGAANIGSGLQSQDYNEQASKAAAQDAINRFNASNKTAMNQYNSGIANDAQKYNTGLQQTGYQNQFQKQAGIAGANMAGVNYNTAQANIGAQQAGNLLSGGIQSGSPFLKPTTSKSGSSADSGAASAASAAPVAGQARGGKIPGEAPFHGDSSLNDIVPIKASPGEVIVPRSLVNKGTPGQIASFVKHPPKASDDKEAMLSALENIRRKRAM